MRAPSRALLRELETAAGEAPDTIKKAAREKMVLLLLALYPEWTNTLMGSIVVDEHEGEGKTEFDPAMFLKLTPAEQEAFLRGLVENNKTKKRRVN